MIDAAMDAGGKRGVLAPKPDRDSVRAMLQAAIQLVARSERGETFSLEVVGPTRDRHRARFIRMGQPRGYLSVETEGGQTLNIHANEVFNARPR